MGYTRLTSQKDSAGGAKIFRVDLAQADTRRQLSQKTYPWAVIHACELARELSIGEKQLRS